MRRFHWFELALLAAGILGVGYLAAQRQGVDVVDWIGLGKQIEVQAVRVQSESRAAVVTLRGVLRPLREVDVISPLAGRLAELRWDPLESTCRHASLSIL